MASELTRALLARGRHLRARALLERDYWAFRRRYGGVLGHVPASGDGIALIASLSYSTYQVKLQGMYAKALQLRDSSPSWSRCRTRSWRGATTVTRSYIKPALRSAGITKPLQPWHGLRHTALTVDAACGNPNAYVQAKAGHSQFSITERYIHAAQTSFPEAAERAEERMFSTLAPTKKEESDGAEANRRGRSR